MATRRQTYTEQTRRALLDSARACFASRGFLSASIAEIAAGADLSPGAVYKHFTNKEELFYQVAEELQREVFEQISKELSGLRDPRDRLTQAGTAFLDASERPDYQQIVCIDYPAVVGEERWRQERPSYTVVLLRELLEGVAADDRLGLQSVEAAAHMIFGALTEGSRWIASSKRPRQAREEVTAFLKVLEAALVR